MTNDLHFSGKLPIIINRSGDARDIFAPLRSSSCDITIVSNKILTDLYTDDKKGIKVKVEKVSNDDSTTTMFEGYLTHNTYSQSLSPNLDNIDMTAIDPIALLKYVYIDDILDKSKSITIGELLAKALALTKIDCNEVQIEDSVSYKGVEKNYSFVDMIVQTNNFWDEGGDAATVYDALSECLRLFGYTMVFTGEKYMIYLAIADHNFGAYRYFTRYRVEDGGTLIATGTYQYYMNDLKFKHSNGDWTTIDDNTTLSIDDTYDRIGCVASTKRPDYSQTAFDLVDSEQRDKYDVGALNVQLNKIKGYNGPPEYSWGGKLMDNDEWFYIWNGVYLAPYYGLDTDGVVNKGFANINNALQYLKGVNGTPDATGAVLNFYGGEKNPYGTGKEQTIERSVEVKECITVFAPDNGVAPEFLEKEDLKWQYSGGYSYGDGENWTEVEPTLNKIIANSSKAGTAKSTPMSGISYSQVYENIYITENAEQTLVLDLRQSYSRTGINMDFDPYDYSNGYVSSNSSFDDEGNLIQSPLSGEVYTYPNTWRSKSITVNYDYFHSFLARDNKGYNYADAPLIPVWDKREIMLYITVSDGTIYQFNGNEWVKTEYISHDNAFYLKKLMNYEKIFLNEMTYDIIDIPVYNDSGVRTGYKSYSVSKDGFVYYTRNDTGGVYKKGVEKGTKNSISYNNSWSKYIIEASEGRLTIDLPAINATNATVRCDIYHSSLLGITGNDNNGGPSNVVHTVYCKNSSGNVIGVQAMPYYLPVNATYIKAEHLNLDISLSVPESNLGQMFGESDIRYQTAPSKRFRESYEAPTFQVNTKHPIVSQSHSYVIIEDEIAEPENFSIGWSYNKIPCRPENYVMQGYKNYYGNIRKTYNRVLVPHKSMNNPFLGFGNVMCFIEAPDIPDVGNGRWLMVLSDSIDVKTNRHTISAVEDYGMNVTDITNYTVIEIPRKARNELYNLPSVKK